MVIENMIKFQLGNPVDNTLIIGLVMSHRPPSLSQQQTQPFTNALVRGAMAFHSAYCKLYFMILQPWINSIVQVHQRFISLPRVTNEKFFWTTEAKIYNHAAINKLSYVNYYKHNAVKAGNLSG